MKVCGTGEQRLEALRVAEAFRAKRVDSTDSSFIFEVTGKTEKIKAFISLMEGLGLAEAVRTGVAALSRGKETL